MTKNEARAKYRLLRQSMEDEEILEKSLAIANLVNSMPIWDRNLFHVFLPITGKREVNTEFLLHLIAGKDKQAAVSKSDFSMMHMRHFLLTEETVLRNNDYGIPEPESGVEITVSEIDVVFVPLIAYDVFGNRVGYGKGFYDIFLSQCKEETLKIGLSFFDAEAMIDDAGLMDVKLDYCVTPGRIYDFSPMP